MHDPTKGDGEGIPLIQQFARAYMDLGYFPFALPVDAKNPPRERYTGRRAHRPTDAEILADIAQIPMRANLGISVPVGVVLLDVDTYAAKTGGTKLCELEAELGALPKTWHSTRRGPQASDGPTRSAIYAYQLPAHAIPDSEDPPSIADIGGCIEVVHYGNRYLVVAPSVVDGMAYQWFDPNGSPCTLPGYVDELPVLTNAWTEHLL
ncbi:bifunctional DNA primase/polymerase [Rhodococcus oryzae]|uniref:bifunctional DNA primase/polymerase n=1 Tax=Rhodococcus oryzae TaxID=2571143 RepID=UPI003716CC63